MIHSPAAVRLNSGVRPLEEVLSEIKKSSLLALVISLPITLICWYATWTLMHAEDSVQYIAGVLLAPALGLISVWNHFQLDDSPYIFLPLVLLAQFIGYFIAIYLTRQLVLKARGTRV